MVWLAVAACLVAACEFPPRVIEVRNESSQTVILIEEFQRTRINRGELGPREVYATRQECVGDFVVESQAGEELARRPGPFCKGDPDWIISDELLAG